MREIRPYGPERGAARKGRSYPYPGEDLLCVAVTERHWAEASGGHADEGQRRQTGQTLSSMQSQQR